MLEIKEIGPEGWDRYTQVSTEFLVESALECEPVSRGLGGIVLRERAIEPAYRKRVVDPDDAPAAWATRHDLGTWGVFLATESSQVVGGAAVAPPSPGLVGVENRTDAAFLFDIRVSEASRRQGVGSALLARCTRWTRSQGFRFLVIETQNTNVPAGRLYAAAGAELIEIRRHGYAAVPAVAHEAMLIWQLTL